MYIIRKTLANGKHCFKTYDGWTEHTKGTSLDLSGVMRFTSGEQKIMILNKNEEFIWFGCYQETGDEQ